MMDVKKRQLQLRTQMASRLHRTARLHQLLNWWTIYWHQRVLVERGLWKLMVARLLVVVRERSGLVERLLLVKRLLGKDRILGVDLMLRGRDGLPCRLLLSSGVLLCGIARFSSPRSITRLTVALNRMPVALRIRSVHGEGEGGRRRSWTHVETALETTHARIVVALPSHAAWTHGHCARRSRISHRGRRWHASHHSILRHSSHHGTHHRIHTTHGAELSSHQARLSHASHGAERSHHTRHAEPWIAVDIVEDAHRVGQLDAIGAEAEPLLAKPGVRSYLTVRFEDISVRVQCLDQSVHEVVHRDLLHVPFVAHVVQVHDVHVAHSGNVDSSIPSNNSTPRQRSATEHAHGRQLHVHVHHATLPYHAVGVGEVAPHARSAKNGAHIAVAHSLVGDHQPSGSGDTRQSEEVNLRACLVGSLQRSTRGVAT